MESEQSLVRKLFIHFPLADEQNIALDIINFIREDAESTQPNGYKGPSYAKVANSVHERLGKYDIMEIEEVYNSMLARKFIHSLDPRKSKKNQHYALGPLIT